MELPNTLKGLGTAVNVCAVIAGGLIGTLTGELINIAKGSRTHKVYIHPLPASPALKKLESR